MCALCPKLYYCLAEPYYCLFKPNQNDKFSSKGVQKSNNANLLNYKNFKNVLHSNISVDVENIGMRYINGGVYYYASCKTGLTSRYDKRRIMSDLVSTCPLDENDYK